MVNSGATAITRKTVSAPTRWIVGNVFLHGEILHYGEGKAYQDTAALATYHTTVDCYDPNSDDPAKRVRKPGCRYDLTVCNYVLNTLLPAEREEAFIDAFLSATYSIFTVRTDKVKGEPYEDGVLTQRGTFQTQLTSEEWIIWFYTALQRLAGNYRVSVLHKTSSYMIVQVY